MGVLAVDPGHTGAHLFQIHIRPAEQHLANLAAVAIGVRDFDRDLFAIHPVRESALGGLTVVLPLLRRIDLRQPHAGLTVAGGKQGDGVAIEHPDHAAGEGFSRH